MTTADISLDVNDSPIDMGCVLCGEGRSSAGVGHRIHVLATEALAVLLHSIPNFLTWHCRRLCGSIAYTPINAVFNSIHATASLFRHQTAASDTNKDGYALLLLHGDHGHPFSTLHLADLEAAKAATKHIYSVHLPYDDAQPQIHQTLLTQAVDKIQQAVKDSDGCFKGIIAIGHSRGAIEAAHLAYVQNDKRISAVIGIAGRYKVTPPPDRAPRPSLAPTVAAVESALEKFPPDNLYQVAAGKDWCTPLEASLTVSDPTHSLVMPDAMHLNVLFHTETLAQVSTWIKDASQGIVLA